MQLMRIHFVGIGGIGMSALAQYFFVRGARVSGSDVVRSEITDALKKRGILIFIGHKKTNVSAGTELVIHSFAVKKDNSELREALRRGIPVKTYAEAVGELTRKFFTPLEAKRRRRLPRQRRGLLTGFTIAVAGAHGKSTTTALVSLMLAQGGFDPTVIVGTKLREFGNTNFRAGKSRYLVVEADEYGESFLQYSPDIAVITNIDREHLDYYKNFMNVKTAFRNFLLRIKKGGIAVINRDDPHLLKIARAVQKKRPDVLWRWYSLKDREVVVIKKLLQIPGEHNVSNALGACAAAKTIGVKDAAIKKVLRNYRGAWRRSEYRGNFHGVRIYDDYGHHPTEIKATLKGFHEKFRGKRIWCVFQPHQIERTKVFLNDFARAFGDVYGVGLLDIYQVAGREGKDAKATNPVRNKISNGARVTKELVEKLQKRHPRVWYLGSHKKIAGFLNKNAKSGDIAILMGAGDIWKNTQSLL